jgi:folate-dependent tRNA-U54 methylase TrmFO/GidA
VSALGGLVRHLTQRSRDHFQPANISWGLMHCPPELRVIRNRDQRRVAHVDRAVTEVESWGRALRGQPA